MKLIAFEDKCVIKRNIGGIDEYDNPSQEVIYSGECAYIEGGYTQSQSIFTRNPMVFLPTISTLCDTNDSIEIETKFGRSLYAVVAMTREIELPMTRDCFTRLELKQATE